MNLSKKKLLASKTLNVGKKRIAFVESRIDEIKDAITRQDIRELQKGGAIIIKEIKGRKKKIQEKRNKGPGSIRIKVNKRKKEYMTLVRKLRKYVSELKSSNILSGEDAKSIRKKIRDSKFKSKSHLKTYVEALKK